jgi:hypothetical protein
MSLLCLLLYFPLGESLWCLFYNVLCLVSGLVFVFEEYISDIARRVFCVVGGEVRCIDVWCFLCCGGLGVALAFHVLKEVGGGMCGLIIGIHEGCASVVTGARGGCGGLGGKRLCTVVVDSVRIALRYMGVEMLLPTPSSFLTWAAGLNMSLGPVARKATCDHSVMPCFQRCVRRLRRKRCV